jgi:redox-sensitive bicupin YhaK (pirin superfamily)
MEPSFIHYPASSLPEFTKGGCTVRVIMGRAYGIDSPVLTYSETLYAEARLPSGASLTVLDDAPERAVYVVAGNLEIGGHVYGEGTLAVLRSGVEVQARATSETRALLLGGAPLGPRHIWWNFVSSRTDRIEQAKRDWAEQRIGRVEGDDEFIPLPER